MRAVIVDFTGTLFHIESAEAAVVAALGEAERHRAPELVRYGAINGSPTPAELPAHLADVWARRDLSADAHRAAYSGLAVHAGLTREQADRLYARGISVPAWSPYPDTVEVLERLRDASVPVALLSNIGWDPYPVLEVSGVLPLLTTVVLSYLRGVQKPDPDIFALACAELGVAPTDTLMVGDTPASDGAATAIGCRFALVPPEPDRAPDTLLRAVGAALPGLTSRR